MKKILASLLVLALCTPAMAAVTVTTDVTVEGQATITLTAGAGEDIVAIGMLVDAQGTDVIDSYTVDSFFDIFIDIAYDEVGGDGYDYGEGAQADMDTGANPAGPGQTVGLPTADQFSISVGGLGGAVAPLAAAPQVAQIVLKAAAGATVDLALDTLRGGIVGSSGVPHAVTGLGTVVITDGSGPCYTGPDFAEWQAVGEPESWCTDTQCHGDADDAEEKIGKFYYRVGYNDIDILLAGFKQSYVDPATDPWIAADFNHAQEKIGKFFYRVGYDDIDVLLAYFKTSVPTDCLTATPVVP